ncbi:DoxX family protein [Streptomyces flaveolus]|uniref:DoxX family protein n=1 Tax=Streptomyces flaveolus TaxID=67297 RepID=UPI0033CA5BB1
MNTGLLILRLAVGLLVAGHGVQKVTHRLGGQGLAGGVEEFRRDGFRGVVLTALAAGGSQIGSGLLLAIGAVTPLAAMGAMGVMTVAVTVKWRNGFWVQHDGYEFPFLLVVTAAVLAATGPGSWSLDAALAFDPPWWAAPATVVGGVGSGLLARTVLVARRPA